MIKQLAGLVLALLMSPAATLEAQSLADVARKEQERRTRVAKPAPVYTNEDLAAVPASDRRETKSPSSAGAAAEPQAVSAPTEVPKAREKRDERYWRERTTILQERIERLRGDTAALEARMNSLRSDAASAPSNQAAVLNSELRLTTSEFIRFQNELRLIEQEWNTFEQRARDANIPARWLQR